MIPNSVFTNPIIGSIFNFRNMRLKCTRGCDCVGCYFDGSAWYSKNNKCPRNKDSGLKCIGYSREDKLSVKFIKVK